MTTEAILSCLPYEEVGFRRRKGSKTTILEEHTSTIGVYTVRHRRTKTGYSVLLLEEGEERTTLVRRWGACDSYEATKIYNAVRIAVRREICNSIKSLPLSP